MYKISLLDPMDEVINVTGLPMKAAGWYGHTSGLHTVAIKVQNFRGRISVQASIVNTPTSDADWFTVLPGDAPYIQFPQNPFVIQSPATGETTTYGFNFNVNAIWVRALVDRSYIIPVTSSKVYISQFGLVDSIKVTF